MLYTNDIILIPPILNPVYSQHIERFMPLGLLALAANLRLNHFNVQVYQPKKRLLNNNDYKTLSSDILDQRPRIIGFSTWCISYPASLRLAQNIKFLEPDMPVVFGGPQASILDKETLAKYDFVDYILRGEADNTLVDLVRILTNGKSREDLENIAGLTYRIPFRNTIKQNEDAGYIENLNSLPIPAYDLIPKSKVVKLDVGRGCPFKCTFCTTSHYFSRSYRVKSASRIIQEMDLCYQKNGIKSFGFAHDMFTLNKNFVFELCKSLNTYYKKTGVRFKWSCSARPDCVSEPLLKAMKEAGCTDIFFGVESGSEHIQKIIRKNLKVRETYKIAEVCSALGIRYVTSFMCGFPEETRADLNDTMKAILELGARGAKPQMAILSVLPDTPIHNACNDRLKYDGIYSDFSSYVLTREDKRMIKNDPVLFGSFYYLPVTSTTRENLLSISRMVNDLRDFPITLRMISAYLRKDIDNNSLFDLFENKIKHYRKEKRPGYPELYCLIEGMYDYIAYLEGKGLPVCVKEILYLEAIQKTLSTKLIQEHINHPERITKRKSPTRIDSNIRLKSTGLWALISTGYRISSIIKKYDEGKLSNTKLRYGVYNYLVVAQSERKSMYTRLTGSQYTILQSYQDKMSKDLLNTVKVDMDEKELQKFLKRMIKIGVFRVEE